MSINLTVAQKCVVDYRTKNGYECHGMARSRLNDLMAVVLVKGKHVMVVNSLGYDEYTGGGVIIVEGV